MRLLLYLLPALLPALAAPAVSTDEPDNCEETDDIYNPGEDGPTHDGSAGLGFEFESVMFKFKSDGCSMDHTNDARKNLVANRKGNNWILTADTGDDPGKVNAEYIVDGTQVKVGQNMAGPIGKDIAGDLKTWSPWNGHDKTVNIANNKCNPWTIDQPKAGYLADDIGWSPQVTAPMPLEGLYDLMYLQMKDHAFKRAPTDSLTGVSTKYFDRHTVVTKRFFSSKPNGIDPDSLTNDVLAFLSLVVTYAKNANSKMQPDLSPKFFSTFMPRDTFTTLYNEVKTKIPGDLWDLINVLVCYNLNVVPKTSTTLASKPTINKEYCSGTINEPKPGSKLGELKINNANANGGKGETMSIKDWIQNMHTKDLITEYDKTIDGSLGGLGSKMEKMYGSDREVPLFEFRDLSEIKTSQFESFMEAVDEEVQKLHKKYPHAPK